MLTTAATTTAATTTAATTVQEQWEAHAARPLDLSMYAEDATVTFVPTAAGGTGKAQLADFYRRNGTSLRKLQATAAGDGENSVAVKERSMGAQTVTEESLVTLLHDVDMDWLLPGVKPTQRSISVPMVCVTRLDAHGLVAAKRFYWDQATVLRQISMLPSDVNRLPLSAANPVHASVLPVLTGFEMAARWSNETDPSTSNLLWKKLPGNEDLPVIGASATTAGNVFSVYACIMGFPPTRSVAVTVDRGMAADKVRPSTRLNSHHVGGKSTVFDQQQQEGVASGTGRRVAPPQMQQNTSHFSLAHDGTPKLQDLHLSRRPGAAHHNATSAEWTTATQAVEEEAAKVAAAQAGKELEAKKEPYVSKVAWESSSNGLGTMQNRSSSRVLQAPGGGSTLRLY